MYNYKSILLICLVASVVTECLGRVREVRDVPDVGIHGGTRVVSGEFPFFAHLRLETRWIVQGNARGSGWAQCGGSIIAKNAILTAAHCVVKTINDKTGEMSPSDPSKMKVYLGEIDQSKFNVLPDPALGVKAIVVHKDYSGTTLVNDIAVLILEEDIDFDKSEYEMISLPSDDASALYETGAALTVCGHGLTEDGAVSQYLLKLTSKVTECAANYQAKPGMMCNGVYPMKNRRVDQGDSGGPLFTKVNGKWVQLSLVSWGPANIQDDSWSVSSNVSYFKTWIEENVANADKVYASEITAKDTAQEKEIMNLRSLLFKALTIKPEDKNKYVRITITSAKLATNHFVSVYDGDSVVSDQLIAVLSATDLAKPKTYKASQTKGLTVAVTTTNEGKSTYIVLKYQQESDAPTGTACLTCPDGYVACTDRKWCIKDSELCDDDKVGHCWDMSDEGKVCDASKFNVCNRNDDADDGDDSGDDKSCETKWTPATNCSMGYLDSSKTKQCVRLITAECVCPSGVSKDNCPAVTDKSVACDKCDGDDGDDGDDKSCETKWTPARNCSMGYLDSSNTKQCVRVITPECVCPSGVSKDNCPAATDKSVACDKCDGDDGDDGDKNSTVLLVLYDGSEDGTTTNGILVASTDGGDNWAMICEDGLGENVASVICRYFGYSYGTTVSPSRWSISDIGFGATNLVCPATATKPEDCKWDDYEDASVPCYKGQQVALACSDKKWASNMEITAKVNKKKTMAKISMELTIRKNGLEIPFNMFVGGGVGIINRVNVNDTIGYEDDFVKLKYKKNKGMWFGKTKKVKEAECVFGLAVLNYKVVAVDLVWCDETITEAQITTEMQAMLDNWKDSS